VIPSGLIAEVIYDDNVRHKGIVVKDYIIGDRQHLGLNLNKWAEIHRFYGGSVELREVSFAEGSFRKTRYPNVTMCVCLCIIVSL
jgi:hypothetical protein